MTEGRGRAAGGGPVGRRSRGPQDARATSLPRRDPGEVSAASEAGREPAGRFSAWLRETLAADATGAAVDVPCGDCVACCTSSYFIHIRPDEERTLARVPGELLVPAPGAPPGHVVMGYDLKGRCPMLREGRCSVYADRPLTCRTYDCRVFAAAGIDADRPAITRRARTWAFDLPSDDDRRELAAVRAAAAFLRDHPDCFAGGPRADNPAHVALAAVRVYDVFLQPDALPPESRLCELLRERRTETHG